MLRLVNQILDFRKIQNKKMKLLVEESDIIALLRKITDSFQLVAEEKQIDCKVDTDCKELYIWIDRDKFEKSALQCIQVHPFGESSYRTHHYRYGKRNHIRDRRRYRNRSR